MLIRRGFPSNSDYIMSISFHSPPAWESWREDNWFFSIIHRDGYPCMDLPIKDRHDLEAMRDAIDAALHAAVKGEA